ncbi:MAG: hypothetical protein RLP44_19985 [Aggregatilineales bacterium]
MNHPVNLIISISMVLIWGYFMKWTAIELGIALRLYSGGKKIEAQFAEARKVKMSFPLKHYYRYRYVVENETYEFVRIVGRVDRVFDKKLDRMELLYLPRYPSVSRPYTFPFARILVIVMLLGFGLVSTTIVFVVIKSPLVYGVWVFAVLVMLAFPKTANQIPFTPQ